MRKSNHIRLREALRSLTDGATVQMLSEQTGIDRKQLNASLRTMPDAYIDRWAKGPRRWAAVWRVVAVPAHCPEPDRQEKRPKREPVAPVYKAKPCALQKAWGAMA
jgi:hypothetical protein